MTQEFKSPLQQQREERISDLIEFGENLMRKTGDPTTKSSMWSFVGAISVEASRKYNCTIHTANDYAISAARQIFSRKGWKF